MIKKKKKDNHFFQKNNTSKQSLNLSVAMTFMPRVTVCKLLTSSVNTVAKKLTSE